MRTTTSLITHSGYALLFDPAALAAAPADQLDLEFLEHASQQGTLLFWPAMDDETFVHVLVDEPLPEREAHVATVEHQMALSVPSGRLWLVDPAYLGEAAHRELAAPGAGAAIRLRPGRHEATALVLDWPVRDVDSELRRAAGRVPVAIRDALALITFFVGAVTLIGVPVFAIGRALDDGVEGLLGALGMAAIVLLPLWVVILVGWRLSIVRRVTGVDEKIARRHPDAVVTLARVD